MSMHKTCSTLFAALACLLAAPAFAAPASPVPAGADNHLRCDPPVVQSSGNGEGSTSQYLISCEGAQANVLAPRVTFSGEILAKGTPPYLIKAAYSVDARDLVERNQGTMQQGQVATGDLMTSTASVAHLPSQFSARTVWDPLSGTLSIEDRPDVWHAFSLSLTPGERSLRDAGEASAPVTDGRTISRLDLGSQSRFSGKGADAATLDVRLGLRDGRLEVQVGESREASLGVIQEALARLDHQPKDMTRAWALAARAQFLGLASEVRYAEQKVAAHNPNLLDEFQQGVQRIKPYSLP